MHVGETWRDVEALGVDLESATAADVAHGNNPIARDRQIAYDPRTSCAVEKRSASDNDVVVGRARDGSAEREE